MCATCGCGEGEVRVSTHESPMTASHDTTDHEHDHDHSHDQGHSHDHDHRHSHEGRQTVSIEQDLLAKNDVCAERNRGWLAGRGVTALNVMSSPGAGKTTLLVRTITELDLPVAVIEGDQETFVDADEIRSTGRPVIQINTGAGCHLDADMLARGLDLLDPASGSLLFIENVGNLVCPALFDLGEAAKVVIISVPEGDNKPLKYPHMFTGADLVLINKSDLLAHVDFDLDKCTQQVQQLNPDAEVIAVSATRGEGLDTWFSWLTKQHGNYGSQRQSVDTVIE